jgi:hypothetical protein
MIITYKGFSILYSRTHDKKAKMTQKSHKKKELIKNVFYLSLNHFYVLFVFLSYAFFFLKVNFNLESTIFAGSEGPIATPPDYVV